MTDPKPLTYRDAGVDIDAGDALVSAIKPIAARTQRAGCLGSLGGFGGLFHIDPAKYADPVLISGTDGVGTKLRLAFELGKHNTIGIDLVAMCVNDVIVQGAEPLFFLDYFATGKLESETATRVIEGIGRGCELAGCALLGGETAEMPDSYPAGEYDLAGFCVGVVERSALIDGTKVKPGDVIIGMPSSGVHSNGFSLVRRVIEHVGAKLIDTPWSGPTLGDALLAPTTIYVKPLLELMNLVDVHAMAHITGGGLPDNMKRVLVDGQNAAIDPKSWKRPEIFSWLQESGNIEDREMWRTFNCGIGMTVIVDASEADKAIASLKASGADAMVIGTIESTSGEASVTVG